MLLGCLHMVVMLTTQLHSAQVHEYIDLMSSPPSPQSVALGGTLKLQCSARVSSGLAGTLSYTWYFVSATPMHLQRENSDTPPRFDKGGFVGFGRNLEVATVGWQHAVRNLA